MHLSCEVTAALAGSAFLGKPLADFPGPAMLGVHPGRQPPPLWEAQTRSHSTVVGFLGGRVK